MKIKDCTNIARNSNLFTRGYKPEMLRMRPRDEVRLCLHMFNMCSTMASVINKTYITEAGHGSTSNKSQLRGFVIRMKAHLRMWRMNRRREFN